MFEHEKQWLNEIKVERSNHIGAEELSHMVCIVKQKFNKNIITS